MRDDIDIRQRTHTAIYALKHDGAFHRIKVKAVKRVSEITIRSGYYAPGR